MSPHRILLDTDPGSDIDDALAICYLLAHPGCELLGITTVTGEVEKRAAIVEILCNAAKQPTIPILCGRGPVLGHGRGQPLCPQYDPVSHLPHRLDRPRDQAVDFLRKTIRAHPGEITLFSIGPLGNVATLFALDPEIPHLLRGLVSMAGAFEVSNGYEWNCIVDPTATTIVTHTPRSDHYWISLDATLQTKMDRAECERRFSGPLLSLVLKMATKWFDHTHEITFHDPLAAVTLFREDLVTFRRGTVSSDTVEGVTTFTPDPAGRDLASFGVDASGFFGEFFSVIERFESSL